MIFERGAVMAATVALVLSLQPGAASLRAQTQSQSPPIPVPRPFPQPSQPPPSTPPPSTPKAPAPPAPAPAPPTATPSQTEPAPALAARPTDQQLGVSVYPAAEFIESYDAGRGQHYYLFGTNAAYADIVAYYRNILHDEGRELFKAPAMEEFDLGRFRDDAMAYPPSVVVKDYTWTLDGQRSDGYLAVFGTTEKRFRTVIQIVPASGK